MKSRRIIGSVLTTVLTSSLMVVVATSSTPAAAVDPVPTRIVSGDTDGKVFDARYSPLAYGGAIDVSVNVQALLNGVWTKIYYGPISVTRTTKGSKESLVLQSNGDNAWIYSNTPARGNGTYTVYYGGGQNSTGTEVYAPAAANFAVKNVQRKITVTGKRKPLGLAGRISPKGKYRVIVLKKVGKKWKKYKTVRSTKRGTYFAQLPAPRKRGKKILWKLAVPGSGAFSQTNSSVYYTTRY